MLIPKYFLVLLSLLLISDFSYAQTPIVTINSDPTSACQGSPIKFTATPTNGGASPSYQWQVNGNNTGTSQNTFTTTSLADGDVVLCKMTVGGTQTVNSNQLTMTILSPPKIVQQDMSVCNGSSVQLQADVSGDVYAKYKTIDFSNQFNFSISHDPNGAAEAGCPTGNVVFNGVPFHLFPWTDNYTGWSALYATGPDPRQLTMPVNEDGVVGINLIANTVFGIPGPASYVSVTFWGNGKVVYQKDLIGDVDIRDFNNNFFTNSINNITTLNAYTSANGQNRLDNVYIQMPSPARIDKIVVNDHGGDNQGQRIFIVAATVQKKPLSLTWSTGETTASITVKPTQPTIYTAVVSNGVASCSSSINIGISTPVTPTVAVNASATSICLRTPVTFTATPTNAGTSPVYQWIVNSSSAGTNSPTFTTNNLANGDMVSCVLTSSISCVTAARAVSNIIPIQVIGNTTPSVTISTPVTTICTGTQATFTATPVNGGTQLNYQWQINGNNVGTNSITFANSTFGDGDVVSCVMTSSSACTTTTSVTSNTITIRVINDIKPVLIISTPDNIVCGGKFLTFTAESENAGTSVAYQWKVNGTDVGGSSASPSFILDNPTDKDVVTCVMTGVNGCMITTTTTSNAVTLNILPPPNVSAGLDVTISNGDHTQLTGTASGDIASVQWSPATGLSDATILQPVASPVVTTLYTLTVTTKDNCSANSTVKVKVLQPDIIIPTVFTPNHDGINDAWNIKYIDQFSSCTVSVFNRYGQRVFYSSGYTQPWDGTCKNRQVPAATYYYIIDLKNGAPVKSGYLALLY